MLWDGAAANWRTRVLTSRHAGTSLHIQTWTKHYASLRGNISKPVVKSVELYDVKRERCTSIRINAILAGVALS